MSDAWNEIQAIKSKRNSLREKLEKRKRERQDILGEVAASTLPFAVTVGTAAVKFEATSATQLLDGGGGERKFVPTTTAADADPDVERLLLQILADQALALPLTSTQLAQRMNGLRFKPVTHAALNYYLEKLAVQSYVSLQPSDDAEADATTAVRYVVTMVEHERVQSLYDELVVELEGALDGAESKRKFDDDSDETSTSHHKFSRTSAFANASASSAALPNSASAADLRNKHHHHHHHSTSKDSPSNTSDIIALLAMPSTREKQIKLVGEEILELLSKPTAKERSLAEKFKSHGGAQVMEFCPHGTRTECMRTQREEAAQQQEADRRRLDSGGVVAVIDGAGSAVAACRKLHFRKIIQAHTDETLGDCSFLNTCFHMDSCKYVHYKVDAPAAAKGTADLGTTESAASAAAAASGSKSETGALTVVRNGSAADVVSAATASKLEGGRAMRAMALAKIKQRDPSTTLHPPQWIQCDLRFLDMTVLGNFAVIMADPPWDIHMELPYGTMSDDEMRQLGVPALQDDGLIFLWVTGRAMELGRECLKLWGYERFDELIWVKTNQLQRIIRTGRTGHWLNHGKEHCLVGTKGNPMNLNRGLDCDVIVAEVRATSHKPDEIYGIIERLSPGTRKIELFGRPHNVQPNWITLGNQLDGIRLVDPELIGQFQKRYPDGNCMAPNAKC